MSKIIKWIMVFLGLLSLFGCFDSTQSQEKKEDVAPVIKSKVTLKTKKSLPFKEVKSLEKLEFFKKSAIANKKFLMVYFYSNDCHFCDKMKSETFSDFRVQEELEKNYSVISINYVEHKDTFKDVFALRSTPAIFFFDREGNKIEDESFYDYQGAEDFYNKIGLLAEPF
jgi:thioredoxin-related protein